VQTQNLLIGFAKNIDSGDCTKGQITLSEDQFNELHKTVERLDVILKTIEIRSSKKLMASLKRSEQDVKKGRVRKLKDLDEIKTW